MAKRRGNVALKPTADYILQLRDRANQEAGPLRRRWETVRKVRTRKHEIIVPEQFRKTTQVFYSQYGEEILGRVTAHLTRNFPAVQVNPWDSLSETAQENSTLREKWTSAVLTHLDREAQPDRWYPVVMGHAASYGMGVLKLLYVSHAWPDYPVAETRFGKAILDLDDNEKQQLSAEQETAKRSRLPFWIGAVDPNSWWGFYSDRRLVECIEESKRTVLGVLRAHPTFEYNARTRRFRDMGLSTPRVVSEYGGWQSEEVEWIEHWDETYVTYLANGEVVAQFEHRYKEIPYYPFHGRINATADPGQRPISLIDHYVDLIILYDHLVTYWVNYGHLSAFPMMTLTAMLENADALGQVSGDGENDEQTGPDIAFEPGKFVTIPRGWKIDILSMPNIGPDLLKLIQHIDRVLSEAIPNVMRGVGQSDQPGYAIRQLIDAFRIVLDPLTEAAGIALERLILHIWWLIENRIKEPVPVLTESANRRNRGWLSLSDKDIHGYYSVTVSVKAYLPNTRQMDGRFGLEQVNAGGMSMKRHMQENLGIENPEEEELQIFVEQEKRDPQSVVRQKVRERALQKAGWIDKREEERKAMMLSAAQLPPGFEAGLASGQSGGMAQPGGVQGLPQLPQAVQPEPLPPGMPAGAAGLPAGMFPGGGLPSGAPPGIPAGAPRTAPGEG